MPVIERFDCTKLEMALSEAESGIEIDNVELNAHHGILYVMLKGAGNLRYLKLAGPIEETYNCINIYHGESSKSGYWWDGPLDYKALAAKLMDYSH